MEPDVAAKSREGKTGTTGTEVRADVPPVARRDFKSYISHRFGLTEDGLKYKNGGRIAFIPGYLDGRSGH